MRSLLRTVLVAAFLMAPPAVLAGQSSLGFRGGLSLASLGGDDAGDIDTKKGFSFGGFLNVPVSSVLAVQVGAGFTQKGATETEYGVGVDYAVSYIETPLLLTLSPSTSGNVGFHFFIGPALAFKASCAIGVSQAGVTVESTCSMPGAGLKSIDLGAMVGAGLEIGLTESVFLVLDGLYNLGLTKMGDGGLDDDVKNRAFSFLAGLSFPLGG
jgi:hypothetical protein